MTIISYAQNFEDVMLYRALKNVKQGFYVDVGANHSVFHSVTKVFYDNGWRGINVEPIDEWFDELKLNRPNDINLKTVIGLGGKSREFYEIVGTGLSTLDMTIAQGHVNNGFSMKTHDVQCQTLTHLLDQHAKENIHFLKIDVEGAEGEVLESLDLKKYRPWIVVVESTLPLTRIESHRAWENYLIGGNYHFVYFDALNRYYVANERSELDDSFRIPPSMEFDDFTLISNIELKDKLEKCQKKFDLLLRNVNEVRANIPEEMFPNELMPEAGWLEASKIFPIDVIEASGLQPPPMIVGEPSADNATVPIEKLELLFGSLKEYVSLEVQKTHLENCELKGKVVLIEERLSEMSNIMASNSAATESLETAHLNIDRLIMQKSSVESEKNELLARFEAVEKSWSWSLSKPVRLFGSIFLSVKRRIVSWLGGIGGIPLAIVRIAVNAVVSREYIRIPVLRVISKFPFLQRLSERLYSRLNEKPLEKSKPDVEAAYLHDATASEITGSLDNADSVLYKKYLSLLTNIRVLR